MNHIKDKVVLITGAGKGAGRALAEAFAARGAFVAANDISPNNVEQVVAGIIAHGGKANAYVEDIAKKAGVQTLVKHVEDDLGRIDILVNHAAVEPHAPLLNMDEWDWHRTLDVNLTGAFLMIQSVGRVMQASSPQAGKGKGVIINIVAGAGEGADAEREAGAYLSSKAGLAELSRQANQELSPQGVQVYAVENSADIVKHILFLVEA
ncbi:MAG TPA: SDR family NAD(P)-dependent oxidoreductase [Anaerolineales bacterium]|nr:SDR family NAD(P)-dependent oxidoreductase [Anaerolineales bacterium]